MLNALLVIFGGALGALLRYGAGRTWPSEPGAWPRATLAVNLGGALLIGLFYGWQQAKGWPNEQARLLLVVGFLGGLTTFSAFSFETLSLLRQGQQASALGYVLASNLGCVGLAWLGWRLAS